MAGIPIETGGLDRRHSCRKDNMRHAGRRQPCDRSDASRNQKMVRIDSRQQKLEEERKDSPLKSLGRAWPC